MLLSYLSFFTFLSCITLGVINLALDPKAKLNRAFFLISLSSALWAFAYIFVFIETDRERLWLWYRVSTIGGLFLLFATFNFLYIFADLKGTILRVMSVVRALYLLPLVYLVYLQFSSTIFVVDFVRTPLGNAGIIDPSLPGYYLLLASAGICVVSGAVFLVGGRGRNTSKRYAILIRGLIVFTGVPIVLIVLLNFLLPGGGRDPLPFPGVITLNITVAGIFYLITRYRLLRVDYSLLKPEQIVAHISDTVLILDTSLAVITANASAGELLAVDPKSLRGERFPGMVRGDGNVGEALAAFVTGGENSMLLRLSYLKGGDDTVMTETYLSLLKDGLSDVMGVLVISKEIRGRKEFREVYGVTGREMEVLDLFLAGHPARSIGERLGISSRTVETHLTSIYNRTGINNKAGLFSLCAKFKLLS
jgi:DNA-binding CsgD family transcriptional regulator/PAS domain-containing protein